MKWAHSGKSQEQQWQVQAARNTQKYLDTWPSLHSIATVPHLA